jgi:hypothetical protein
LRIYIYREIHIRIEAVTVLANLHPTHPATHQPPFAMDTQTIADTLSGWGSNFKHNFTGAFKDLDAKGYIRLVIIVGTYCLIRPYIIKLGGRVQRQHHEKESAESAEISPNDLRGGIEIPGVEEEDEEVDEVDERPGNWGRKARVRQRRFVRDQLKKHEDRLRDEQEDEEDKEIEEFLTG